MSTSSQDRPITQPVTARGQRTRQKLLEAAEAVFGEKGYDRASIAEITRRAGVAQGTFYVYFPDKKAIFVELVRELSHRLRREIAEAVAGLSDRMEIERVGLRTFFSFAHRHRNLYKIVRQAEFVDEELFRWYYRRLAEGYARGLAEAMEKGQVRRLDPECLAYCLMGIADFLGMRWVLWEGQNPPDGAFETMMAFIRHGMDLRCEAEDEATNETKGGTG
ncbi:MAG: TetR/AcrR family transcriptional regulator [Chloroflexi bacterium]|nr:MAG: TetR/AcrR family transcriptional regulator [Chloroflexota bacterium]